MKTNYFLIVLLLVTGLLSGCRSEAKVGPLQTESQSVDLGNAKSVDVNIDFGAGNLKVTGGASKLMEAEFNYNVARLKPEVKFADGTLLVQQPKVDGLPVLQGITDFRNEWNLYLADQVPMNLKINMGAGTSDLQLSGLSLTGLGLILGAGRSTVDLSGNWVRDLDVTIDTGAADVTVRLPKDVGVRLNVDRGPTVINAPGFNQDGNVYTNTAYGASQVTLRIDLQAGIGQINLELVGSQ